MSTAATFTAGVARWERVRSARNFGFVSTSSLSDADERGVRISLIAQVAQIAGFLSVFVAVDLGVAPVASSARGS
jgi:hypothetical protein